MAYAIYTDFILGDNNIKLSSFGGVLFNQDNAKIGLLPSHNILSNKFNSNNDGEVIATTSLDPRIIPINMYFENDNLDIDALKQWLYNDGKEQWFRYVGSDRKIKVIYKEDMTLDVFNDKQSTLSVNLYAYDPKWYLTTGTTFTQDRPSTNQLYTFNNPSNVEKCYPLIHLEVGSGVTAKNIIIEINGNRIKLANIYTDIYLDSKYRTCYTLVVGEPQNQLGDYEYSELGKHKYYFPILKVGNNTFKLIQGTLTKVTIEMNSTAI